MKETLKNCPLCGAEIKFAYNKSTKLGYYRCSNTECHFRVGMNYSEKEVSLQGIELNTECKGCGSPLTIACGPKGLYATCLKCDYDLKPNMITGFIYRKHANAHNLEAQEEIENLVREYKGIIDENYSYDDFAEPEEIITEESTKNPSIAEEKDIFANVDRHEFVELYNKGYTINQLSQHFGIARSQSRGIKKMLLDEGVINTYVSQKHPRASVHFLDNIEGSTTSKRKQKEIRISETPREGSSLESILNYFKANQDRGLSSQSINKETGIRHNTICNYLTQLRKIKAIKIVGYEGENNPLIILYALKESPLPELEIVKDDSKYITVASFFKKYMKLAIKASIPTPTSLNKVVEESNLQHYMILTKQGLRKSYLEKDLLKLVKDEISEEVSVNEKEFINKGKEKHYEHLGERIINFLRKADNINNSFSISDISKNLKINEASTSATIKLLRNKKKMKIVGNKETKMLFQVTESPLPELDLKSNKEYMTPFNFYQNNKSSISSLSNLENQIKKARLEGHKIITRRGIGIGYNIGSLEKLIKKEPVDLTSNDNPIAKTTSLTSKNSVLDFVTSIFRKNGEVNLEPEETISF